MVMVRGPVLKIVNMLLLLTAVAFLNFTLIYLAPGDAAEVIAVSMGGAAPEILESIRHSYGLDLAFVEQFARYMRRIAGGDLGRSFYFNEPVLHLIVQRLPATALLVLSALCLSVLCGVALGTLSARKPKSLFNHCVSVFSLAGYAAPVFWTGIVLLVCFASAVPLFPVSGMEDVASPKTGFGYGLDVLHHLTLPAVTLSVLNTAQYCRLTRASLLEILQADYIRTARAKGLSEGMVLGKHALRNALIPVITVAGMQFGSLFAGAVLVETVFAWPGLGRLVFDSILRRDYPVLLGILLFSAVLVMSANILTDLAYRAVDPRIRKRG
jgi:peptide/nickel transport system permease protein